MKKTHETVDSKKVQRTFKRIFTTWTDAEIQALVEKLRRARLL